ncbi:hypothetical protein [Neptuniibacter sp. QD37_11]|uniref:hypothetical protein n=1 Tax=Neptuniibacter sp. QD37_11 TaxID=3398209 RepID=UPI0039F5C04D
MTNTATTYRFTGEITAEEGLAVSRPGDNFSPSDKTARLPRAGAKTHGSPVYFPSSTIRGAIRRACRDLVYRACKQSTQEEKPWTLTTHMMNSIGVDITDKTLNEKTSGLVSQEGELRDKNPLLSLFGRWKLAGHWGIGNAHPKSDNCVYLEGSGARTNEFVRSPDQVEWLKEDDQDLLVRMINEDSEVSEKKNAIKSQINQLKKQAMNASTEGDKKSLFDQIRAHEAEIKKIGEAKEGSQNSIQRPLDGFEAIRRGTVMDHKMILENSTGLELGLALASLREFARKPYMGAHKNYNFGQVSGQWTVRTWAEDADAPEIVGTVGFTEDGFTVEGEVLQTALRQWDEVKSDPATAELDFEAFMIND